MKGNFRWLAWTALAALGMGALWCCRTEVSGGLDQEISSSGGSKNEGDGESHALGTNLAAIGYAYRTNPFVDLRRSADPFFSGTVEEWNDGRTLELRPDGYPARLAEGQVARTFLIGGDQPHVGGQVVVRYEGEGQLEYRGGVEGVATGSAVVYWPRSP